MPLKSLLLIVANGSLKYFEILFNKEKKKKNNQIFLSLTNSFTHGKYILEKKY